MAALAVRVDGLERRMGNVELQQVSMNRELAANTVLTRQVHEMAERTEQNTKDMVDAIRWISTSKRVIVSCVAGVGGAAGAVVAINAAGKAFGWW